MENSRKKIQDIKNHLANFGFVFQGSEIYGGLANTWDYGPLGILLINNIKKLWWREFITKEPHNYGIDSKIIMNNKVWEASGHIANFSDPLIENYTNGKRYRADQLLAKYLPNLNIEAMTQEQLYEAIIKNISEHEGVKTQWSKIRQFQLMFKTSQGVIEGHKASVFLRPETAQGIFTNFKNVQRSMRTKLPFGIGQIGKSFRNEVTPSNYIFRTREFEQMELEYFVKAQEAAKAYEYYLKKAQTFLSLLGIKSSSLRYREHNENELAHYAQRTTDIEFHFPFGWGELMGVVNRSDFDLKAHQVHSGESLEYLDPATNQKIMPYVIEPSIGVDRLALAILVDAFNDEKIGEDTRLVLKLAPQLAPYQVAILPLSKKHHAIIAKKVFQKIIDQDIVATYDETGSIGKRYRRQDAIGTPLVITIIDQTDHENLVTIRFRDSMQQKEINLDNLKNYL